MVFKNNLYEKKINTTFVLENINHSRTTKVTNPHYYATIRALIRDPPIKPKDIIPITMDLRIQDQHNIPKLITCQIISKYENVTQTLLKEIKIKNKAIFHDHFDWHVPNMIGEVAVSLRFIIDNITVAQSNIEYTPLRLEITK